jgi:hypothetical protein
MQTNSKRWIAAGILLGLAMSLAMPGAARAQDAPAADADLSWPALTRTSRPWTRWWWPGSAVDAANLTREMEEFKAAGIGGVEITPIYGVHGAESRNLNFLSPEYMAALKHVGTEGGRLSLGVDMATGTGWPMGGPWISPSDADAKVALVNGKLVSQPTGMQVKRAAPGDVGNVVNPYSRRTMQVYLKPLDDAFKSFPSDLIRSQFHDSFEYMGNWSDELPAAFKAMHGYDLADHAAELFGTGDPATVGRVKSDYRQTLGQLHEQYVSEWIAWTHAHGWLAREQAHGAPANLLDLYALADIPETEMFSAPIFDIPGYRREAMDFDPSRDVPNPMISRFASSAAHVAGHPLASSETFTWMREHFRGTLSEAKPELDQLLLVGINHVLFHGTCYSPSDATWPGWNFYASTEFNSRNTIWHDLPAMNEYITRCQLILQGGQPDNDVLLYWPVFDLWNSPEGMNQNLVIGGAWMRSTDCAAMAKQLNDSGYAFDFVSDRQLSSAQFSEGAIHTPGGHYQVIVVPRCTKMPVETMKQLISLANDGATVIFVGDLPGDVPGLGDLDARQAEMKSLVSRVHFEGGKPNGEARIGKGRFVAGPTISPLLEAIGVRREPIADTGVGFIRRVDGARHDYFLANLTGRALDGWVPLGVKCQSAALLDPLSGDAGVASIREDNSTASVYLQLQPGQSIILRAWDRAVKGPAWHYLQPAGDSVVLNGPWDLSFTDGGPALPGRITLSTLKSWTTLDDPEAQRFAGTGRYHIEFDKPAAVADDWMLDLGDVRESARVTLNGQPVGTLWSLPFRVPIGALLRPGRNVLDIDVTNLAANRIRDLDARGEKWKIFYDANIVSVNYKPFDASKWPLVDSGLIGPVRLVPMHAAAR